MRRLLCVGVLFSGLLAATAALAGEALVEDFVHIGSVRVRFALPDGKWFGPAPNILFEYRDGYESLVRAGYEVPWYSWGEPGLFLQVKAYKMSSSAGDRNSFETFEEFVLDEYDFDDSRRVSPMGSDSDFDVVGQVEAIVVNEKLWLQIKSVDDANPETVIADVYVRPLDRNHFLAIIGSYRVGHWGDRRNLGRRMELVRGVVESVQVVPWDAPRSGEK